MLLVFLAAGGEVPSLKACTSIIHWQVHAELCTVLLEQWNQGAGQAACKNGKFCYCLQRKHKQMNKFARNEQIVN